MSWLEYHQVSERLASEAQSASRHGQYDQARDLYSRAAEAERQALSDLDPAKTRTFAITAVSAASLYYKAGLLERAADLAQRHLEIDSLPEFAKEQLTSLLKSIWGDLPRQQTIIDSTFLGALNPAEDRPPTDLESAIEELFFTHGESNQIQVLFEQLESLTTVPYVPISDYLVHGFTINELHSPWRLKESFPLEHVAAASPH